MIEIYGPGPDGNNYLSENPTENTVKDDGKDPKLIFGHRFGLN